MLNFAASEKLTNFDLEFVPEPRPAYQNHDSFHKLQRQTTMPTQPKIPKV